MSEKLLRLILFCILIASIGMASAISIDMYAPAMPEIAKSLHTSATAVQWSLSIYVLASMFGVFSYGALSDSYGRKRILTIGFMIGIIGGIVCSLANSIHFLYLGRLLQGLGLSVTPSVLPAVSRDVFSDKQLAQVASVLSLAFGLGPVVGPLIGGYIAHYFGWSMIFVFLVAYSTIALMLIFFFLEETHVKQHRQPFKVSSTIKNYASIWANPVFFKNMFSKATAWMSFLVFYTVTPFMLQVHLHMNMIQYGWVTIGVTGSILLAKGVNTFLVRVMDINKTIMMSLWMLLGAGLSLLVFACLGYYTVFAIVGPFVLIGFASGFPFSNAMAASFQGFKRGQHSGSIAGLLNGSQLIVGFLGSAIAAHIPMHSLLPLALLLTGAMGLAVSVYYVLDRRPSPLV